MAAAKRQALAPLSPNVAGISDVGSDMFGSSGSGKPASPAPGNPSPPTPHAPALLTPSRIRRGPPPPSRLAVSVPALVEQLESHAPDSSPTQVPVEEPAAGAVDVAMAADAVKHDANPKTVAAILQDWEKDAAAPAVEDAGSSVSTAERLELQELDAAALDDVLLWRQPARTAGVCASGTYALIVVRSWLLGSLSVQPSSVLAYVALAFLALSFATRHMVPRFTSPGHAFDASQLEARAMATIARTSAAVVPVIVALSRRLLGLLSGRDGGTTLRVAAGLHALHLVGERLLSTGSLLLLLWLGAFTVPYCLAVFGPEIAVARAAAVFHLREGAAGLTPRQKQGLGAAAVFAALQVCANSPTARSFTFFVLLVGADAGLARRRLAAKKAA